MTDVVMAFAREMWWPHHESRTRDVALAALDAGGVGKVTVEFEDIVNIVSAAMGQAGEPVDRHVIEFLSIVHTNPGGKLNGLDYYPSYDRDDNNPDVRLPPPLWKVAEDGGWVKCLGSYKWELTDAGKDLLFGQRRTIPEEAPLPTLQRLGQEFEASDIVIDLDKRRVSALARAGLLLSALVGKGDVGGQDPDELFAAVIMALGIEEEAYGDDRGVLRDVAKHPEEHLISDRLIDLATKRGKE